MNLQRPLDVPIQQSMVDQSLQSVSSKQKKQQIKIYPFWHG
jgi:hypothetical protein